MPWKLVSFLSILVVITVFIGFNLDNRCDVSVIFYVWKDVPIFVSLLFAYVVGAVTVIPFFVVSAARKRAPKKSPSPRGSSTVAPSRRSRMPKPSARDDDSFGADNYDNE